MSYKYHNFISPRFFQCWEMVPSLRAVTPQGRCRWQLDERTRVPIINRTLQLAVTYSLEILGEAAKKLSAEAKSPEPKIPWKEIAGFCNRAAHEYFNIRLSIVWHTVEDDIPVLFDAPLRMKQRDVRYEAHGH